MDSDMKGITHVCIGVVLCCSIFLRTTKGAPLGCEGYVDLYFVVDASESIIQDDPYGKPLYHWKQLLDYTRAVIDNLPLSEEQTHIGMVKYSDSVYHEFGLTHSYSSNELTEQVRRVQHLGGNTDTADALQAVTTYLMGPDHGGRNNARKIVVLLTDGISNRESYQTIQRALELKRYGVEIFVVSMEMDVDEAEISSIASDPSESHVIVQSFLNGPSSLIDFTVYGICKLPTPTPPPPDCNVDMDLAIVIDNSGSIKNESTQSLENKNYDNLKKFVKSLIDTLTVGQNRTRVAAIRFSDRANTVFKLDTFYDKVFMKQAIDDMPFDGGLTNISGALKQIKRDVFDIRQGDRPDIRNVVIIIADGESNVDPQETSRVARDLKSSYTRLYVVAVLTTKFDETELRDIASNPDADHYFNSPSIANLPAIKYSLLKHVCEQEVLQQDPFNKQLPAPGFDNT